MIHNVITLIVLRLQVNIVRAMLAFNGFIGKYAGQVEKIHVT